MANAVIKHFRRYEYLISNDVITLAKRKVEITSAFSGSLRISINWKTWLRLERLKCVRNRSIFEFFRSSAHHYSLDKDFLNPITSVNICLPIDCRVIDWDQTTFAGWTMQILQIIWSDHDRLRSNYFTHDEQRALTYPQCQPGQRLLPW